MMIQTTRRWLAAWACLGVLTATAQEDAPTVASDSFTAKASAAADTVRQRPILSGADSVSQALEKKDTTTYFNALQYALQKRYRPKNGEFRNDGGFLDNTFVSIAGGVQKLYMRDYHQYKSGPMLQIAFGKHLTPLHALRLNVVWNKFRTIDPSYVGDVGDRLVHAGLEVDYLFNLPAYVRGYDPYRKMEFAPLIGIGGYLSRIRDVRKQALGLHGGFQWRWRPVSRVAVFLEPRVDIFSSGIDHSPRSNWHRYNLGFGAMAGVQYNIRTSGDQDYRAYFYEQNRWDEHLFAQVMGGVAVAFPTSRLGLGEAMGPNAGVAIGKWFMPAVGVRLSAFWNKNKWGSDYLDPTIHYNENYLGGRVEAMLNLLALFRPALNNHWLEFNALAGLEVGRMKKEIDITPGEIKQRYAGFTGGVQLKGKFLQHFGVFVEPRISRVPYSLPRTADDEIEIFEIDYISTLVSVSLGVQVDLNW